MAMLFFYSGLKDCKLRFMMYKGNGKNELPNAGTYRYSVVSHDLNYDLNYYVRCNK